MSAISLTLTTTCQAADLKGVPAQHANLMSVPYQVYNSELEAGHQGRQGTDSGDCSGTKTCLMLANFGPGAANYGPETTQSLRTHFGKVS